MKIIVGFASLNLLLFAKLWTENLSQCRFYDFRFAITAQTRIRMRIHWIQSIAKGCNSIIFKLYSLVTFGQQGSSDKYCGRWKRFIDLYIIFRLWKGQNTEGEKSTLFLLIIFKSPGAFTLQGIFGCKRDFLRGWKFLLVNSWINKRRKVVNATG